MAAAVASSDATDRCRKLLKKTQAAEKSLKELLVTKRKSPSDPKVVSLRSAIRDNYEEIIFLDHAFASRKDVELSLWKSAFYKPIEEYRYRIRKLSAAAPNSPDAAAQKADTCKRFRGFLAEAGGFYTGLLRKMQIQFQLEMGGLLEMGGPLAMSGRASSSRAAAASISSWRERVAPQYVSCHRSLIFLGDLNRYREQHRDGPGGPDFSSAAKYYTRAIRLLPTIGNPFNQLAVLATYDDDECDALYRYCRSLCLRTPFDTARDNMRLLFEKNREKMQRLGQNSKRDAGAAKSILARFRTRFVRLHGILHTGRGLETFGEVQNQVMNDLAFLHKGGVLDRTLALRLLAVNAFSLFQLHTTFDSANTGTAVASKANIGSRGTTATAASSAACACVFSLCCATFSMLVGLELKNSRKFRHEGLDVSPGSSPSMLSTLAIVAEWFARDLLLLVSPGCGASFELPVWHSALGALTQLLHATAADESGQRNRGKPAPVPLLEEDVELQGFLPFKLCHLSCDARWKQVPPEAAADALEAVSASLDGAEGTNDMRERSLYQTALVRLQLLADDLTANRVGEMTSDVEGADSNNAAISDLAFGAAAGLWYDGVRVTFPAEAPDKELDVAIDPMAMAMAHGHGAVRDSRGVRRESRLAAAAAATQTNASGAGEMLVDEHNNQQAEAVEDDDDMMDDEVILFAPPRAGAGTGSVAASRPTSGSLSTPGGVTAIAPPLLQQHRYQQPRQSQPSHFDYRQTYGATAPLNTAAADSSNPFSAGFGGFAGFGGLTGLGPEPHSNSLQQPQHAPPVQQQRNAFGVSVGYDGTFGNHVAVGGALGSSTTSLVDMLAAGTGDLPMPPGFQHAPTQAGELGSGGGAAAMADQMLSARCANEAIAVLPPAMLPAE